MSFELHDSGKRAQFDSGMVRDTAEDKIEYDRCFDGPMFERWAILLTKAAREKYHDETGTPNWMKANSEEELQRFKKSLVRHVIQLLRGDRDEDHGAAIIFNVNGYEYARERIAEAAVAAKDESFAKYPYPNPVKIVPLVSERHAVESTEAESGGPDSVLREHAHLRHD